MTPEFFEFKKDLLNELLNVVGQRTSLISKINDHGNDDDSDPHFYLYLAENEDVNLADDNWTGRYVLIGPSLKKENTYRIGLMERVLGTEKDYGPSFGTTAVNATLIDYIVSYLVDGVCPDIATVKH